MYIKPLDVVIETGNSLPLCVSGSEQPKGEEEETVDFTFTTTTNPAWEDDKEWGIE